MGRGLLGPFTEAVPLLHEGCLKDRTCQFQVPEIRTRGCPTTPRG